METGAVRRPGPGRPRVLPDAVVADKGYSYPRIRKYLKRKRVRAVISSRSDQVRPKGFSRRIYRQRNRVERLISLLKHNRRVATRYEKRGQCYLAMVVLAAIRLWL